MVRLQLYTASACGRCTPRGVRTAMRRADCRARRVHARMSE
jgi:hypothetical protein